jgi:hypothetical protein
MKGDIGMILSPASGFAASPQIGSSDRPITARARLYRDLHYHVASWLRARLRRPERAAVGLAVTSANRNPERKP